ncbi:site-2 protease family protein, partial [Sphingomonas bacterium]
MGQLVDFLHGSVLNVGAFIAVLGVLIFVHEMGHYLAARWQGVYV